MNARNFKPCLDIEKIPFHKNMTNNELRIAKLLKKVANKQSRKSKDLAIKYYNLVLCEYKNLLSTRFFVSYVYLINEKYGLDYII